MSRVKEFTQNTFFMTSSSLFNMLVALASMFFYTRVLAPLELALIPVLDILASVVYIVSNLGLGLYVQRKMPAILKTNPEQAEELSRLYALATFVISALCCGALYWLASQIAETFLKSTEYAWQMRLMIPAVLVTCLWMMMTQIFLGTSRFVAMSLFSIASQVIHPLAIIGLYFVGGTTGLLIGLAVGKGLVCLVFCWSLRPYLFGRFSLGTMRRFITDSWPFYLEGFMSYPMNFADRWLVGILLTPVDLATYYVPRTMYERLINLLKAFTNVMLASLSVANAEGGKTAERVFNKFCRVSIFLFMPLSIGLFCLSYYLVDLLAGPRYHAGIVPFAFLVVALLIQGFFTPHYLGLVTLLPPKKRLTVVSLQSIAVFVFVIGLGYVFQLNGVAASRFFVILTSGGLSIYFLRALFPIHPDLAGLRATLLPSVVLAATLIGGQLLWYNFIVVPVYALVGYVAYVLIFLRTISREDFETLLSVFPEKLARLSTLARRYRDVVVGDMSKAG